MTLKKEQLQFIQSFNFISNKADSFGTRVFIEVENGKLLAYTANKLIGAFYEIEVETDENFSKSYEISDVFSVFNFLNPDQEVVFDVNGFKFGKAYYDFPSYEDPSPFKKEFLKLKEEADSSSKITINGLDRLSVIKPYASSEEHKLSAVKYYKNYILGATPQRFGAYFLPQTINETIYFNTAVMNYLSSNKIDSIEISILENKTWAFKNRDIQFFIPAGTFEVPDLLGEKFSAMYNHSDKIMFNRVSLQNALKRLSFVAKKNSQEIVSFTLKDGKCILNTIGNSGKGEEEIGCVLSNEAFNNSFFVLKLPTFLSMISSFASDEIYVSLRECSAEDKAPLLLKVFNPSIPDLFFVLSAYEKIKKLD